MNNVITAPPPPPPPFWYYWSAPPQQDSSLLQWPPQQDMKMREFISCFCTFSFLLLNNNRICFLVIPEQKQQSAASQNITCA